MNISQAESYAAERGIIDALSRGLLTQPQAMKLLGISDEKVFAEKKEKYGYHEPSEAMDEGSIADGFINYWESTNTELE